MVHDAERYLEFVHLPSYVNSSKGVLADDDQRWLEQALVTNPESGALIAGTGGVRKLRVPLSGGGKRGGARVIYYHRAAGGRVYLLLAYGKNERGSISKADKNEMRKLTACLEGEL